MGFTFCVCVCEWQLPSQKCPFFPKYHVKIFAQKTKKLDIGFTVQNSQRLSYFNIWKKKSQFIFSFGAINTSARRPDQIQYSK